MLGSALAVKPLLTVADGEIRPFERVRTSSKALSRLEELSLAALERANDDPTVQAAKEKKWDAITPAERTAAREVYRKAMQEAMVKIDPSLAPILQKLTPSPAQSSSPAKPDDSNPTDKEPKSR